MSAVLVSERVAIEAVEESVVGSQVVLDLYECAAAQLDDLEWVRETMVEAARRAKATIVETCFHKFSPWGISGVVVARWTTRERSRSASASSLLMRKISLRMPVRMPPGWSRKKIRSRFFC